LRDNKQGHWKLHTLYAFKGQPDAGFPYGGLIFDKSFRLYGTTYFGGVNGMGSVYRLTPQPDGTWSESVLYSFKGGKDGALSTTTLVRDATGNLFGTTSEGGNLGCSCGVIFKMTRGPHGKYTESVAYRFKSVPDGAYSYYGLTPDGLGNLFGTTAAGGIHNQGAIFEFTP
jgi:uncharacterized repeat protein (TIGR03803 family)